MKKSFILLLGALSAGIALPISVQACSIYGLAGCSKGQQIDLSKSDYRFINVKCWSNLPSHYSKTEKSQLLISANQGQGKFPHAICTGKSGERYRVTGTIHDFIMNKWRDL